MVVYAPLARYVSFDVKSVVAVMLLLSGIASIASGLWLVFTPFPAFPKTVVPQAQMLLDYGRPDMTAFNAELRRAGWSHPVEANPWSLAEWMIAPQSATINTFVGMIGGLWALTGLPAVVCAGWQLSSRPNKRISQGSAA